MLFLQQIKEYVIMKKLVALLSAVVAGCCVVFAQPYDTPPFLFSTVHSLGRCDLVGKRYYVTELSYSSLVPSEYESQKSAFVSYLEESFAMRGAVRTLDSLGADFFVRAKVSFDDESYEYFGLTNKKLESRDPLNSTYLFNPSGPSSDSKSDIITVSETHKGKTYVVNGKMVYPKISKTCSKAIIVEAYSIISGLEYSLFTSKVVDERGGYGFLSSDDFMLFALTGAYGRNIKEKKLVVGKEDVYYRCFKALDPSRFLLCFPDFVSSSKKISLFLVEKMEDKIVLVLEDSNCLAVDDKGKKLVASLRLGDTIIDCIKMSYEVPHIPFTRLLKLEFPAVKGDIDKADLFFHKSGKPDKPKYFITGINIRDGLLLAVQR